MSAVEQFLSTEAAQALFRAAYALPAAAAVGGAQKYANSDHLYAELGKLWAQCQRGLETLPPAQAHVPVEGRTIEEDLYDCVLACNAAIWAESDPKPKINGTQVYNKPSSIHKKKVEAAKGFDAQRAADRAAAVACASAVHPSDPGKGGPAGGCWRGGSKRRGPRRGDPRKHPGF